MSRHAGLVVAVALIALTQQGAAVPAAPDASGRIVLPSDVLPSHYDLSIVPNVDKLTFTGTAKIAVDVKASTNTIALNAADLTFGKVSLTGAGKPSVTMDKERETATLTFPASVAAGKHVLTIDYTGKINPHAAGLFVLTYDAKSGKKSALFTQFENSDARRFLPCWDEPNRKATFTLVTTVPSADMVVSNMPVASTEKLSGGMKRVHFAQSPKMSSYLLFYAEGDFERISRKVNGVDIGVVFKRGSAAEAQYALDSASDILPYYEEYFGVKFPLPKLDFIAGPGESQQFAAMENWGAIFYFERAMFIDQKTTTESDKRNVYIDIAHEMAHMWFGDLVTMDWWEDLWLNEGFASWMELRSSDHFNPQWHLWTSFENAKEYAMGIDGRNGTHPIITPIHDVQQADQAFDAITYLKGQAVIRMLESYLGPDAFRAGVRNYIKAHAYGNTVTDDLWRELDKTSPTPVSQIAHEFTLQAGVPLIRVTTTETGVHLTQDRIGGDDSANAATTWHVPVAVQAIGSSEIWHGLVSRDAPQDIALTGGAIVNAGQTGYFRTLYDAASFKPIVAHFHELAPTDQLGLINDTRAEGYAGAAPMSNFLQLASQTTPDMDSIVLDTLVNRLQGLDNLYRDLPGQKAYRVFALSVLNPVFAKVGWDAKPGEEQNMAILRNDLLQTLSQMDDAAVIAEAKRRFEAFVKDASTLSAEQRRVVLQIVAFHADDTIWEQLHVLARETKDSLLKPEYYGYLGFAEDKGLAQRALALSLTEEAPKTLRPGIITAVSGWHPEMAFDFAAAHVEDINALLEPDTRDQYAVGLASNSNDPAMVPKVQAYAEQHIAESARRTAVVAEATIAYVARIRAKYLPEIDKWLAHRKD